MTVAIRHLTGLPAVGEPAIPFPPEWGRLAREGVIFEFRLGHTTWTGNFEPGSSSLTTGECHPNGRDALILAKGAVWQVDPLHQTARALGLDAQHCFAVEDPKGFVLDVRGLSFARLGPDGILWTTDRLSWDGFSKLRLEGSRLVGLAYAPQAPQGMEPWVPVAVDLASGQPEGGSFP